MSDFLCLSRFPELLGLRRPAGGVGITLGAQVLRRLGGLHIRGSRPGFLHDLTKLFRILQHGAGLHHAIMVSHEQRRAHDIQQALLADIGVGIVDECAGIGVPIGIDMQIATPTRDAAVDELRVVLEVHAEQRLAAAVIPDAAIDLGALFRRGQKLGRCVIAHRHVMFSMSMS